MAVKNTLAFRSQHYCKIVLQLYYQYVSELDNRKQSTWSATKKKNCRKNFKNYYRHIDAYQL